MLPLLLLMALGVFALSLPGAGRGNLAQAQTVLTQKFSVAETGEVQLTMKAAALGCDWERAEAEAAVVSLTVDGQRNQELVLYRGDELAEYDVFLGKLSAGEHTLQVLYRPDLSAQESKGVRIGMAKTTLRNATERERLVWGFAPLLYGRPENNRSDVPLLCYAEVGETTDEWKIVYTLIWSNEDGGTNTPSLLARWGRTTDIEWLYAVTIAKTTGKVVKETYQGAFHRTMDFAGERRDNHPILRTVTNNNMVSDTGESPLLFAVAPLRLLNSTQEPREAIMDSAPWTYTIAAKEMIREKKWESPASADTREPSDIRNYLHITYQAEVAKARLAIGVHLTNGKAYFSDHGAPENAIDRSGWIRTTVELPPGTTAADIADIAPVRRDTNTEGKAVVTSLRAFFLDAQYHPTSPLPITRTLPVTVSP